jgi:hypothetical protein
MPPETRALLAYLGAAGRTGVGAEETARIDRPLDLTLTQLCALGEY